MPFQLYYFYLERYDLGRHDLAVMSSYLHVRNNYKDSYQVATVEKFNEWVNFSFVSRDLAKAERVVNHFIISNQINHQIEKE